MSVKAKTMALSVSPLVLLSSAISSAPAILCLRCSTCLLFLVSSMTGILKVTGEELKVRGGSVGSLSWPPKALSSKGQCELCSVQHMLLTDFCAWFILMLMSCLFPNFSENQILSPIIGMCKGQPLQING